MGPEHGSGGHYGDGSGRPQPPAGPIGPAARRPSWLAPLLVVGGGILAVATTLLALLLSTVLYGSPTTFLGGGEDPSDPPTGDPGSPDHDPVPLPEFTAVGAINEVENFSDLQDVRHLEFSADGDELFVADSEGTVWALTTESGVDAEEAGEAFDEEFSGDGELQLSPEGDVLMLVDGDGERILAADTDSRELLHEFTEDDIGGSVILAGLGFTSDGELVTSRDLSGTHVWDPHTGERIRTIDEESGHEEFAVSSDGSLLAFTDYPDRIRVFDMSGDPVQDIEVPGRTTDLAFRPGTTELVGLAEDQMWFWDAATGEQLGSVSTDRAVGFLDHFFDAEGRIVYLWDTDSLYAYDAAAHVELGQVELPAFESSVAARTGKEQVEIHQDSALAPDGSLLVAGTLRDDLHMWRID